MAEIDEVVRQLNEEGHASMIEIANLRDEIERKQQSIETMAAEVLDRNVRLAAKDAEIERYAREIQRLAHDIGAKVGEIERLRRRERAIIDETWGEALEDSSVPSTKLQDKILAAVDAREQRAPEQSQDKIEEGHSAAHRREV